MLFVLMCYQMSLHTISNIFTSSLQLKKNTNNVYDANNQYRLDIQSKATSYSKGMDMMNSDSSISIYDNYRLSMTSKDKAKDKAEAKAKTKAEDKAKAKRSC